MRSSKLGKTVEEVNEVVADEVATDEVVETPEEVVTEKPKKTTKKK